MSSVRYILLCEDLAHARFLREVLKRQNYVNFREIRAVISPSGQGDAKQFITAQFPVEVASLRRRSYQRGLGLAVMIDADNLMTDQRRRTVLETLSPDDLQPDEPVCILVPRWCIETWIIFLRDGAANETEPCQTYKHQVRQGDLRESARMFADSFRSPPNEWIPSLQDSAEELRLWISKLLPD